MEFRVSITLGNDAMQTGEDLAAALEQIAARLREAYPANAFPYGRPIRDANGLAVGQWETARRAEFIMQGMEDAAQLDALRNVLEMARKRYSEYLEDGTPETDYGQEWPSAARATAAELRQIAALAPRFNYSPTPWRNTAQQYEDAAEEISPETPREEISPEELCAAKAQKNWEEYHRFEEYIDFEGSELPAIPFARVTFNTETRTAYASRGNPAATTDNEEEIGTAATITLSWEQAEEIIGQKVTP